MAESRNRSPGPADDWRTFADALRRVAKNPGLTQQLKERETSEQARVRLGISEEMATSIKDVMLSLAPASPPGGGGERSAVELMNSEPVDSTRQFLDSSFAQLRHAYQILMGMSVATFVIGVGFLVLAAVQLFVQPDRVSSSVVIGGIGIAQIVALFLRNPLRDIQRAVSNGQQARVAIMSYMLGVGLVGESVYRSKSTSDDLEQLDRLTSQTLSRLERYTEDQGKGGGASTRPTRQQQTPDT